MMSYSKDSLKDKRLSPEENIVHDLATGLCIENTVEEDLAVVPLLWNKVPGFQQPERKVRVQATNMITIGTLTVIKAGRGGRSYDRYQLGTCAQPSSCSSVPHWPEFYNLALLIKFKQRQYTT